MDIFGNKQGVVYGVGITLCHTVQKAFFCTALRSNIFKYLLFSFNAETGQVTQQPLACSTGLYQPGSGMAWSDNLSFWIHRYKALMVTDTAFYRYPYYHSTQDTVEKLDYPRLEQICEGLFMAVGILENDLL